MGYWLTVGSYQTQDPANNQSTVYATLYLNSDNWSSYAGYNSAGGYFAIGGAVTWFSGPTSFNYSPNNQYHTQAICSISRTFTHDANGYREAIISDGYFNGGGGYAPGPIYGNDSYASGALDYDRKPAAPTTVSITLNADKSIQVQSNAVSSPAGTATYYISSRSSSDGGSTWGSWSSYTTIPSNARTYTYSAGSLTYGLTYQFRMYASNSDGSSAATTSNSPSTVFLPAGGKRFDGSTWNPTGTAKRFDGTNWNTLTVAKRFNGTSWVDMT